MSSVSATATSRRRQMETDRTLLFGVQALESRLITAKVFAEAWTEWSARKSDALPTLLVERGWITAEEKLSVENLLETRVSRYGDVRSALRSFADDDVRASLLQLDDQNIRNLLAGPMSGQPFDAGSPRGPNVDESDRRWTTRVAHWMRQRFATTSAEEVSRLDRNLVAAHIRMADGFRNRERNAERALEHYLQAHRIIQKSWRSIRRTRSRSASCRSRTRGED